jgi:hypothetical protein
MYPAIFRTFFVAASLTSATALAGDSCRNSGNHQQPVPPIFNTQSPGFPFNPTPALPVANASPTVPSVPQGKITVVPSAPTTNTSSAATPVVPGLELTVVENAPVKRPVDTTDVAGQIERLAGGAMKAIGEGKASEDSAGILNSTLKSLIGTWLAVARHGDGELGTVELQLDKDGWAKLTTPGADGKPETVKRRVEVKEKELKLIGEQSEVSLGKIINFNEHQLTLAMNDDQVTFVRP